jgi:helicase MOV-10
MFENSDELPKKKFPVVFHGIVGRDQQEASSPSFFNIDEATLVKKYCKSLVEDRKLKTRSDPSPYFSCVGCSMTTCFTVPEHIGVITPYHAQRCKILDLFRRDNKLQGIKVGSVEEFQGQVAILSSPHEVQPNIFV